MEFKKWLESSSFKSWFRDSKVTKNGHPLVVYHGTPTGGFNTFQPKKSIPMASLGYWFVEDPDVAHMVASRRGSMEAIMPVYLMIGNPKIIKHGLRQLVDEIGEEHIANFGNSVSFEKVKLYRNDLEKQGFDGIILPDETADGGRSTQYVVFKSNQIKSATGNKGTYDASDNIIESIENLHKWFGNSKIVDSKGNPLKLYHGTGAAHGLNKFNPSSKGIYLTADPDYASFYADNGSNGGILPCYAKIYNPFIVHMPPWNGAIIIDNRIIGFYRKLDNEIIQKLKSLGYDGIIAVANEILPTGRAPVNPFEVIAFEPTQIKSVHSRNFGKSDKLIEADWYHGSHEDFDQWDAEKAAITRNNRPGIDTIGLWTTSKSDAAHNYGPKIYKYDADCKNPYVMTGHWSKTHWFAAAFFIPEVGIKFLTSSQMKIMSNPPDMLKLLELARRKDDFDYKEKVQYIKLEDAVYKFRKLAEYLYRETDYIKSLRDYLISKGYDCILWKNSHIDFRDIEHDVAVFLEPEKLKISKKLTD